MSRCMGHKVWEWMDPAGYSCSCYAKGTLDVKTLLTAKECCCVHFLGLRVFFFFCKLLFMIFGVGYSYCFWFWDLRMQTSTMGEGFWAALKHGARPQSVFCSRIPRRGDLCKVLEVLRGGMEYFWWSQLLCQQLCWDMWFTTWCFMSFEGLEMSQDTFWNAWSSHPKAWCWEEGSLNYDVISEKIQSHYQWKSIQHPAKQFMELTHCLISLEADRDIFSKTFVDRYSMLQRKRFFSQTGFHTGIRTAFKS